MIFQEVINRKRIKYTGIYWALAGLMVLLFLLSVAMGTVKISFSEIIGILFKSGNDNHTYSAVVKNIRLPRAAASIISGSALSLAGLLMQIFFGNPIADPFVLGVSSGATLMVGIVTLTGMTIGLSSQSPYLIAIAAMIGSAGVMMMIVGVAGKVKSIITLLVVGLMAGYLCSAVISILVAFAEKESIRNFVVWTMGSFSGFTWGKVKLLALVCIPLMFIAEIISKPLNALSLGENYARSMGVRIKRFRIAIVTLASLLTGIVTAFAGPVAFIGLAVPHLSRLIFRTDDNRILIPGAVLLGATVTALCDLLSRMVFAPVELPISAVTSFIGGPIVIYLLMKEKGYL